MKKNLLRYAIAFLALLSGYSLDLRAGEIEPQKLPSLLAGTNAGNEFYFSFPPCYDEESPGGDNSLRVFVASGVRQEIVLEVESQGYRLAKVAVANDVIEFRIPTGVGQPYLKQGAQLAPAEKVYQKAAVHVYAKAPIICYGVTRYEYTSDGFLAIPINAFGGEYVIAAYPQYTAAGSTYKLPSMTNIVAAYDNTEVSFTMGGTSGSQTTGGLRKGQKATVTMNRGDIWCFANLGDAQDVSGSLVKATKPIGVVSGNQCANVPSGVYACDYMSEMELPTFTWGKEYHVTPIVGRLKAPVIRVFAKERDTKIYRDGKDWFRLTLNSRGEGDAFIERRAFDGDLASEVANGSPCKVVSADKPIYVMLYNPGQTDDNIPSDPFMLVLTPLEQYQREIVFATPGAKGGTLPFLRQYVNLVYQTNPDGTIPDDVEFATVVNGKFEWKKVSSQFGPNPGYKFTIPVRGQNYSMKRLQMNGDGVYRIRAKNPFAAYAYGFANYDSYGFPTSVALGDLEKKDTVKPDPQWRVLCDGTVTGKDGSGDPIVTDRPDDPNLRSNLALIYMDLDSSYNYDFSYDKDRSFIAGTTVTTDWSLKVLDPAVDGRAVLVFVDRAGNDTIIDIRYNAFSVDIDPKDLDMGAAKPGETIRATVDLVNKNTKSRATITTLRLKSGNEGFTLENVVLPLTIPAGGRQKLNISFTRPASGDYQDAILLGDTCVVAEKAKIKASVNEPIIYVSEIDFGALKKGTKSILPLTIRNEGSVALRITGYSQPTQPAIFRLVNWPVINATTPLVLAAGESRTFDVEFTAADVITYTDQIVFSSDAVKRDSIGELRGRGVEGGLIARGADWQRRRVAAGPYPDAQGIILKNIGNAPIRVLQSAPGKTGTAYSYNPQDFIQLTLQPDEERFFAAAFAPVNAGGDTLVVNFETDGGQTVPTDPPLRGAGIIGRLATQNYDFDTTIVQGVVAPKNRKQVVITNVGVNVGGADFSDDVIITDLPMATAGTIGETMTAYGTSGFRYDKAALRLPVTLKQGQSLTINGEFQAQRPGQVKESLSTVSDAENSVTTEWTGYGIDPFVPDPRITAVGGSVGNICIGQQGTITANVTNAGNVRFPVLNAFIEPNSPEFRIDPNSLTALTATTLDLAERRAINILFSPQGSAGPRTVKLAIIGPTVNDTTRVDITGTAVDYSYGIKLSGSSNVLIGTTTNVTISLDNAPDANASLQSVRFTVDFDTRVFSPDVNGIRTTGNYTTGFSVGNASIVSPGKLQFDVVGLNAKFDKGGDIVIIPMKTFLPQDGKTEFAITGSAEVIGSQCVRLVTTAGKIVIDPTCAFNLRGVDGKGQAFALRSISPNPVVNGGAEIVFSVGFKVKTEIGLYNMLGELVSTIASGTFEAGEYVGTLPLQNIPSGSYTVKMVAGPFVDQQQISITK
jgi:hypothetical protein